MGVLKKIFLFSLAVVSILMSRDDCLGQHQNKIGPLLKEWIENNLTDENPFVGVLIRTSDPGAVRQRGVQVGSVAGDIVTAIVSHAQVDELCNVSSVISIELGAICKPLLDKSIPEIGAHHVWNGAVGPDFRGRNVIIGIYDSGIDWSHPDFIEENGGSRILYLWDQTDGRGDPPQGMVYGTEYTQEQINDEIDGTPAGVVQGRDVWGHGTHIAGIAAGNGRGTGNGLQAGVYKGVAPEAELIIVKGGDDFFLQERVIDGINYIFQKAESFDPPRPAVINLSVGGTHFGPHDATSSYERAIDNLLLGTTGRAIVIAAGNDREEPIHFGRAFTKGQGRDTLIVTFSIRSNNLGMEDYASFDIWYPRKADIAVSVITPLNATYGPVGSDTKETCETGEGKIVIDNDNVTTDNRELSIRISDGRSNDTVDDNMAAGSWQLIFAGFYYGDEEEGSMDGWLHETSNWNGVPIAHLTGGTDLSTLLMEPGNARLSITVGSYVSRINWPSLYQDPWGPGGLIGGALSNFTSPGPTRDGRQKPDIIAPGEYVLSSLSSDISTQPFFHETATDGVHWAMKGTSMSAPHVTGVVALMFEADPELAASDIKSHLILSARKDQWTGDEVWNKDRGYGKVDALEAIRLITSVSDSEPDRPPHGFFLSQNYPNPFNGSTIIEFIIPKHRDDKNKNTSLAIYDLKGRLMRQLLQNNPKAGRHFVSWNGQDDYGNFVASGVYFCRLAVGETVLSKKMMYLR